MHFGLATMFHKYVKGSLTWEEVRQVTATKRLDLACCRRDSVAFQVLMAADEAFLLTTSTDPLFWKGGPLTIVRLEIDTDAPVRTEVRLIGLIEDDDGCLKSDVLLEQSTVFVERRHLQQVWVECETTDASQPGVYSGMVRIYARTLFEDERLLGECPFSLTIKDYLLPEPSQYRFYLDLWQHNSNIARKYDVRLWSDEHFAILDRYLHSLAQLGQKAVSVVVSEIPWSGQHSHRDPEPADLFEYSMVRVTRRGDGQFVYDFSAMDRYVALAERYGIAEEIELFGLLNIWQDPEAGYGSVIADHPDGVRIRYYDSGSGTFRFMRRREDFDAYVRALQAHFIEKGWIDRVRVLADEPKEFAVFKERVSALRQVAPCFRYKIAIAQTAFLHHNLSEIHDYVPILQCVAAEYEQLLERKPQIPGKLLYYVCCHPDFPNTFIGSPPVECRLIPWLAEKWKLDGFLRWNYTVWPERPLEKLSYRAPVWKAGDMNFVYPGATGKPLLSLRYKWLQRGIRDYELMQLLKESGQSDQVERALNRVFLFQDASEFCPEAKKRRAELYSLNPADYDRLILEL
ncbi:DUF4091 domain-containing protein [Laceyella sacchari]|uniref:DUF4091 domain-containing protein n=1 Tax=Laceyella sacchari TaxID=37482 RepID=A0ABY5TY79_LACSH|nr:DUF4091 domain-containing protein [Laceyella sacchari]UWE02384.1 DUF4091 domain-containing protein [Laceyella sacchari]